MIALAAPWTAESQQRLYRRLLAACARPGSVADLGADRGERPAWVAVLAVLADAAAPVDDAGGLLTESDRGLIGAPAGGREAPFVLADGVEPPDDGFQPALGTLVEPSRGATLVLACLEVGSGPLLLRLRGPGCEAGAALALNGLHPGWLARRAGWCAGYPCGVDLVLCDGRRAAWLPRHTVVEAD